MIAFTRRRPSWARLTSSPRASAWPPLISRAASPAPSGCSRSSGSPSSRGLGGTSNGLVLLGVSESNPRGRMVSNMTYEHAIDRPAAGPPPRRPEGSGEALAGLISQVARGDHAAFEAIYDELAGPVYGVVLKVLRDPAQSEEVAQEAMLDVWRTASRFDAARGQRGGLGHDDRAPSRRGPGPDRERVHRTGAEAGPRPGQRRRCRGAGGNGAGPAAGTALPGPPDHAAGRGRKARLLWRRTPIPRSRNYSESRSARSRHASVTASSGCVTAWR